MLSLEQLSAMDCHKRKKDKSRWGKIPLLLQFPLPPFQHLSLARH
jgi:hypothetical protein